MAVTTGEDFATVEPRHASTTTTSGAEEPGALSPKVAVRPFEVNRVADVFPVFASALVTVGENHVVRLSAYPDFGCDFFKN